MSASAVESGVKQTGIDRHTILPAATVILATLVLAWGDFAAILRPIIYWAISLLFFVYGAKLSTATVIAGFANRGCNLLAWSRHSYVFAADKGSLAP